MKARQLLPLVGLIAYAALTFSAHAAERAAVKPGDMLRPTIIGGGNASVGEYPFMVTVQVKSRGSNAYQRHWCGASVISPWQILTAAHCVGWEASNLGVIAGRTTLSNTRQGQSANVAAIYVHPKYLAGDDAYDAAILTLKNPITLVAPVELAAAGTATFEAPGTLLTNIGWGNTIQQPPFPGHNGVSNPDRLQEVQLPVVDHRTCVNAYRRDGTVITQGLDLCAGRTNKDACQGDSGGPLFAIQSGNRFVQVGVVSRGNGCGAAGYPGIFTRVANAEIAEFIASPTTKGTLISTAP